MFFLAKSGIGAQRLREKEETASQTLGLSGTRLSGRSCGMAGGHHRFRHLPGHGYGFQWPLGFSAGVGRKNARAKVIEPAMLGSKVRNAYQGVV